MSRTGPGVLRSSVRTLVRADLTDAIDFCERDIVTNVFLVSRLYALASNPRYAGGQAWGWYDRGVLGAVCWSGANLVTSSAPAAALDAFAFRAARQGRTCSSIVGPAAETLGLWQRLQHIWGPAREIRPIQPLMLLDSPPQIAADPRVRTAHVNELGLVLPACVEMFTEEVGYSPMRGEEGHAYRSSVAGLVGMGRSFVRIEDLGRGPEILFKTELGSVHPDAVQLQGVWVAPQYRGQGLAAPAVAAVSAACLATVAPRVTLYVNDFNTKAIKVYERVGYRTVGTMATVLF